MTRRQFLLASATATAAFRNDTLHLIEALVSKVQPEADDESFWYQVRAAFNVDSNMINFNNGGCCPSPSVVEDALKRQIEIANMDPSLYMWQVLEPEVEPVRVRLAKFFRVDPEEVAITRNATEALNTCLLGFDLKPGDEVLTTSQDYPHMITALKQRELRDGIKLIQIDVPPAPKTHEELVEAFERAITPKTKLILTCHVIFMTGQIYPVKKIAELGRSRNIPVVVDGAHAFAQFPFDHGDLDCDYYGTSLHKWLMAPIGTGMLFVRKNKIKDVWPLLASGAESAANIRKFEDIGTHPAGNHNAIGEALTFNEMIRIDRKAERLRYLRRRWTDRVVDDPKVRFHTNLAPEHSCALTNVEITGIDPGQLSAWLFKNGVFVTTITHPQFKGIRVSPNVYTTVDEIDRFGDLMVQASTKGISS